MIPRLLIRFTFLCLLVASPSAFAQTSSGLFDHSTDIGATRPGTTLYKPNHEYLLTGGGADMWSTSDQFRLAWRQVDGDAALDADIVFPGSVPQPLQKAVLIFRQSLAPDAPYADIAIHGDGHITLQYRAVAGGETKDTVSSFHATPGTPARLRIERRGDQFTVSAGPADGTQTVSAPITIPLHGTIYAGLGVCAHNADGLATADFTHVQLETFPMMTNANAPKP